MDFGVIFWKAVIIGILALCVKLWRDKKDVILEEIKKMFKK